MSPAFICALEMSDSNSRLQELLDEYVECFDTNRSSEGLTERIENAASSEDDDFAFAAIANRLWDEYSVVSVDLMVTILRRWVALVPSSQSARRTLGSYLLAHGPDWDDEARTLLDSTN